MKMEWGIEQEFFGDGETKQHLQTVAPGFDSSNGTKELTSMSEILFFKTRVLLDTVMSLIEPVTCCSCLPSLRLLF